MIWKTWPILLVYLLGAATGLLAAPARTQPTDSPELLQNPLQIFVTTGRQSYRLGEPVAIRVMVCNPSNQIYNEQRSCNTCWGDDGCLCCDRLGIIDAGGEEVAFLADPPVWCPGTSISLDLAPGVCRAANQLVWPQTMNGFPYPGGGTQVEPGTYTVRMRWSWDGPVLESEPFEILAQQYQPPIPAPQRSPELSHFSQVLLSRSRPSSH